MQGYTQQSYPRERVVFAYVQYNKKDFTELHTFVLLPPTFHLPKPPTKAWIL